MIDLMAIATEKTILRVARQTTDENGNHPVRAKILGIIRKVFNCQVQDLPKSKNQRRTVD